MNSHFPTGTRVQGWQQLPHDSTFLWDQYWFIEHVPGQTSYTITDIKSGTVVDLAGGKQTNGTDVQGWERHPPSDPAAPNQEWYITSVSSGVYQYASGEF